MPSPTSDGGYLLPDPIDGDRICVEVSVPDIPEHRAAFVGALQELSRWWNWQRDTEHTAVLVAQIWAVIVENVLEQLDSRNTDCTEVIMDVRQNVTDPCILEKTVNGTTWTPFADLRLCMPRIRFNLIYNHYEWSGDGIIWIQFPQAPPSTYDPAIPTITPPPRTEATANDRICLAAANCAYVLRLTYNDLQERMFAEVIFNGFDAADALGLVLGMVLDFAYRVVAAAVSLATIVGLQAAYQANDFTDAAEAELVCILIGAATDTGGVITFDWNEVFSALSTYGFGNFPELDLLQPVLSFIGGDGLNMAGAVQFLTSSTYCDCPLCGEPINYIDSPQTAVIDTHGEWVEGLGFRSKTYSDGFGTHKRIDLRQACIEELTIHDVDVHIASGYNSGGTGSLFVSLWLAGVQQVVSGGFFIAQGSTPRTANFHWAAGVQMDEIRLHQWAVNSTVSQQTVIDSIHAY